jgi:hypothetical protein
MASTVSGRAMGRSGTDSLPPPLIRQGLTLIFSSSTATLRIALSSRYAFSGCVLLNDRGDTESADRWSWLIAAAYTPTAPFADPVSPTQRYRDQSCQWTMTALLRGLPYFVTP